MSPAIWVPLLVVGIFVLQAAIWVPLVVAMRKRAAARMAALQADLASSGERVVRGPLAVRFRRGYTTAATVAAITERRLVWLGADASEVPLDLIRDVRTENWFNTSGRAGYQWLVVKLDDRELGFSLPGEEAKAWAAAIRR